MKRRAFLAVPALLHAVPSAQLRARMLRALETIETIDTHEHLLAETQRVKERVDFYTLASHYVINDVNAAGMPFEARTTLEDPQAGDAAKWKAFGPYWQHARFTGYSEALRIAVRDIYGFSTIDEATIPRINAAIAAKNKPGLYGEVLKTRMRLRYAVNDEYWSPIPAPLDASFFVLAQKFDGYVMPITRIGVGRLAKQSGVEIGSLADLKRALEATFKRAIDSGMVTVKSTAAYQRDLRFDEVSAADAERDFQGVMKEEGQVSDSFRLQAARPYRRLANHMFHHLVSLADAYKVPFQVHTGLQAGNGNFLLNSNPTDLTNLFFLFPRVKFDLFHIGYPWWRECAVLAKTFQNVYLDFCWMHVVSPSGAKTALNEMLDTVPVNKIFGYGGDYRYPEVSYGHLKIAQRNIATVLAERVEDRTFTETEAATIGRMLMLDNPDALFKPRPKA